ncbi:hypothetical protein H6768_04390 [Candidatus Peribacteria bacterium]|nr:hypothetical protein [Candidatus Peribacteria bacterium]
MMKNKTTSRESGSALLVTIMITSVVLLFAMILLERIIPYSKQIRGMQDSLQAYYTAKSQIEIAKNEFQKKTLRENISTPGRILTGVGRTVELTMPNIDNNHTGDYVVVSNYHELPLQIRMYEKDDNARGFGTSQKDPNFHNLSSYGGGLLFDLSSKDTTGFTMNVQTEGSYSSTNGNIYVEFVYNGLGGMIPFFGTVGDIAVPSLLNGKVIATAKDTNREVGRDTLTYLLNLNNCAGNATCSLKLHLKNSPEAVVPVAFSIPGISIPDINAVVIADGLSNNTTYHARIVELIPLTQSI